jgi:hypothetical protein
MGMGTYAADALQQVNILDIRPALAGLLHAPVIVPEGNGRCRDLFAFEQQIKAFRLFQRGMLRA